MQTLAERRHKNQNITICGFLLHLFYSCQTEAPQQIALIEIEVAIKPLLQIWIIVSLNVESLGVGVSDQW